MVASLEENNQNRSWWYSQLNLSEDWNSMSIEMRSDLVKRLQRALLDLTQLNLSKDEMSELVLTYDQSTVWDAMLALQDLVGRNEKTHWELLAYMKKTASNMWKAQHPSRVITWQKPDKVNKKKQTPLASDECVELNDPINFNKRFCRICKRKLRVNNTTGICSQCQRHGNGKDNSEH